MERKRVVITGIGVIAPNAIGKDNFWEALRNGRSGIKPITVFDTSLFKTHLAGECTDFKPEELLGETKLRNLDRATKMVLSAAKLCIDDACFKIDEENTDKTGVVTATTLSVIFNISEFTKEAQEAGPQLVNPAMFPSTTINAPSSQISIKYKIKGFNTTVSTGFSAGLDALKYASDMLILNRAEAVLVCAVEALFFQSYVGFYKLEFLAGIKGEELSCPFDKRRNGIILGEAAAAILLETEGHAIKRKARIYGELKSVETFFDPFRSGRYGPQAEGLKRCIISALKNAHLKPDQIDYVDASANSVIIQDLLESKIIKEIFSETAQSLPVSSIKSMVGETVSASGVLQVAASLGCLNENFVYPTINYQVPDPECDLDYVTGQARSKGIRNILINCFGPGGNNASCIVGMYV
ncbi:MAG: beta-ketoacyl-[acyl-carrier-protein] synthase family protein [Candidatus Omnitrophica bacterium]|nr:beta-ketoacyl-[acyl-carrier-protein] synthase family protein [Candidatus Omnitrophota bacterium]